MFCFLFFFFWYERCTWNRCQPCVFVCSASVTGVRVECRNYWAIRRPTTNEPITRNDRTLPPSHPPRGQLNRATDFRGEFYLTQPSIWYLMSQTQFLVLLLIIPVFFLFLFCIQEYTHWSYSFVYTTHVAVFSIFVFLQVREKAIIHIVLSVPTLHHHCSAV